MSKETITYTENNFDPLNKAIDESIRAQRARIAWQYAKVISLVLVSIGILAILLAWAYNIYKKPNPELVEKISNRTLKMIKSGALKEVKDFLKLKISKEKSSNKVIGISEIRDFIKKQTSLNELTEKISIKTRQYAKRQATWARGQMFDWQKVNSKDLGKFLKKI